MLKEQEGSLEKEGKKEAQEYAQKAALKP